MELEALTVSVRSQLVATAALGDERTREIAEALALAAEPAVRLALLNAASAIAEEMNAALLAAPGHPSLSVRLEDGDIRVEVSSGEAAAPVPQPISDDGEATARVSLRLSDALKADIDEAARREGVSVNTWLVRSAAAALAGGRSGSRPAGAAGAQRITGWING